MAVQTNSPLFLLRHARHAFLSRQKERFILPVSGTIGTFPEPRRLAEMFSGRFLKRDSAGKRQITAKAGLEGHLLQETALADTRSGCIQKWLCTKACNTRSHLCDVQTKVNRKRKPTCLRRFQSFSFQQPSTRKHLMAERAFSCRFSFSLNHVLFLPLSFLCVSLTSLADKPSAQIWTEFPVCAPGGSNAQTSLL